MYRLRALLLSFAIITASCKRVPFYRRDYTYLENFEAFYKLHETADSWTAAFDTCDSEDSQLFYPSTTEEASVVQTLVSSSGRNVTDVVLGLKDDFHLGEFITINGKPTPIPLFAFKEEPSYGTESECVFLDMSNNYSKADCNQKLSFICKKVEDVNPCPTIDRKYIYESSTGKCYKVNSRKQTWQEAMTTCFNEGALLVILNNRAEAETVGRMLTREKQYHAGIRRISLGEDLFTVKGTRLDHNAFQLWYDRDDEKDCGTIWYYNNLAYYKTTECDNRMEFVCEMMANCTTL